MLLEQFDESKTAVINPSDVVKTIEDMPEVVVSCFERSTFGRMLERYGGKEFAHLSTANMYIPIYSTVYKRTRIALIMMYVGAPGCAGVCEELYSIGAKKIILFGTCGVLDKRIRDCSIIVPNVAMRDEGTSYHYVPASDEINVNENYIDQFTEMLDEFNVSYTIGKTWTTDAIYRETRTKVQLRKSCGCVCVDMECSAAAAVAAFRGRDLFQFFYAADNLDSEKWDSRSLSNEINPAGKDKAASIAMEFAVKICDCAE